MARKSSKKLVYVLSSNTSDTGHSLGVNALAVDSGNSAASQGAGSGILYSAGRDGLINTWQLNGMDLSISQDSALSLAGIRSPSRPSSIKNKTSTEKYGKTTPSERIQIHTNWVNDMILTSNARSTISCSSDLTVKLWTPSTNAQTLLGRHTDYVKCLTQTVDQDSWVVSGGLDRKLIAWDIKDNRGEMFSIDVGDDGKNPMESVYAVAVSKNNPTSPVIASGGPQGIISLWDPKDPRHESLRFAGHTGGIRSLLVSQDSKWLLSASSDSTVKLWSTTAGRLLHSFDMHNDSVWSLLSLNDNLDVFYSTDRSGIVAKTELRNCASKADLDDGFCTVICNEHQGVFKVAATDNYIWTATSNSRIHRWPNINTAPIAVAISATNTLPTPSEDHPLSKKGTIGSLTSLSSLTTKLAEINAGHARPNGSHSNHHSNGSNTPHANGGATATNTAPSSPPLKPTDPQKTELRSSFLSLFGGPNVSMLALEQQYKQGRKVDFNTSIEDCVITVEPRYENPVETLEGRIGLLKHRMLNDRRRALTLDTAGDIKLWDLVTGRVLQSFDRGVHDDIDDLADQMTTFTAASNWCQVAIRTGELFVYLDSNTCFDSEVYADELIQEEDLTVYDAENPTSFPVDHRLNYGRWVITNLLRSLTEAELKKFSFSLENGSRPAYSRKATEMEVHHIVEPEAPKPAVQSQEPTEKSGGKFMGKLRGFGKKKDKKEKEAAKEAAKASENAAATAAAAANTPPPPPPVKEYPDLEHYIEDVIAHPKPGRPVFNPPSLLDAPLVKFSPYTKIMISEQSPTSGGSMDIYRGTVGSIGSDVDQLEKVVPDWVGRVIMNNELPVKEPVKVGFVFKPMDEGDKEVNGPNIRLTAFQMLRAYKMAHYVEDRLKSNGYPKGVQVELYCQNNKLAGNSTLATIRTRYWRSGGDVVIKYKIAREENEPKE